MNSGRRGWLRKQCVRPRRIGRRWRPSKDGNRWRLSGRHQCLSRLRKQRVRRRRWLLLRFGGRRKSKGIIGRRQRYRWRGGSRRSAILWNSGKQSGSVLRNNLGRLWRRWGRKAGSRQSSHGRPDSLCHGLLEGLRRCRLLRRSWRPVEDCCRRKRRGGSRRPVENCGWRRRRPFKQGSRLGGRRRRRSKGSSCSRCFRRPLVHVDLRHSFVVVLVDLVQHGNKLIDRRGRRRKLWLGGWSGGRIIISSSRWWRRRRRKGRPGVRQGAGRAHKQRRRGRDQVDRRFQSPLVAAVAFVILLLLNPFALWRLRGRTTTLLRLLRGWWRKSPTSRRRRRESTATRGRRRGKL